MPTLNIEGRKIKVDDSFLQMSPEEQSRTVDEIANQLGVTAQAPAASAKTGRVEGPKDEGSAGRSVDSFGRGAADIMSFGLADEISGLGNAVVKSLNPFKDYSKDFPSVSAEIQKERDIQKFRDENDPVSSTVGRVAGGLTQGVGMARAGLSLTANAPAGAGLLAKMGRGAAEGAAYGAAYGAGSGEGLTDRASKAVGSGAAGAVIGGAVPAVVEGVKAVGRPIRDAVMARVNPGGYAGEKIAERLANSNLTVDQAAQRMGRDNVALADIGGQSTRDLLRTTTNIPGPARDRVASQLTLRQMGQGDRLRDAVSKTLADPDGYLAVKDDIAETAKRLAGPLYKQAYETPVHFSEKLEGVLNTPAGKAALRKAEELAGNEQVPFQQLFVNLADDGTGTVRRVPDTRGWDYIKRAMDDMIDGQTDSITKKVTNEGRILTSLKNRMLSEIDQVNPAYKAARQAWGGQQSLDNALEFGRKAMTQSPESVRRAINGMGPAEKEAARAGGAEWVRNAIDQRNFTQNAILKFFSNRQQVANLRSLFDNNEQFATFRRTIFAEAKKRATYEAVKGNSTTARQMADLFETGGMQEGFNAAKTAATQGVIPAALQWVGSRLKMLGGLTPEVADQISRRLMTTNPQNVQRITQELAQLERANLTAAQRSNALNGIVARALQAPVQSSALQPQ